MSKRLEVIFLDDRDQQHYINFSILDSDLANRWVELVQQGCDDNAKHIHSSLANISAKSIPRLHARLNSVIENINNQSQFKLPTYDSVTGIDATVLNDLHEKFEEYGAQIENLHNNFIDLNELIHACEDVIKPQNVDSLPVMHCQFDFYPQDSFNPILEQDKLFLETEFKWGNIYLGYNTLGKDWLKVCLDNDVEVIERDMVKPQKRFAAETFINFGPDCNSYHVQKSFSNWYNTLPEELKIKVPINNLNELCLGRFIVGRIIINEYFLKYDSDINNWKALNSKAKRTWNDDVFSTFTKIVKVQIKNA
jgi:hypothetical protein